MKAIILAAGMGTRLGTLIPKPLTSICNENTVMDLQIAKLAEVVGVDNIMAVVGYKKELIMEKFPEIMFVYNHAYTQTNTSKSLLAALKKIDDDVIWMNGDVYFDEQVLRMLESAPTSSVLVDTEKCGDEEIKYNLDENGNVVELSKQVVNGLGEAVGINLIKKQDLKIFIEALEQVMPQDYFEKALENLTKSGKLALKPVHLDGYFCKEIDFQDDLEEVQKHIKQAKGQ